MGAIYRDLCHMSCVKCGQGWQSRFVTSRCVSLFFNSLVTVSCNQIQLSALQDLPPSKGRSKAVAGLVLLNPPALLPLLGKDHCLSLLQGWDLTCLVLSSLSYLQFFCPVEPGTWKSCSVCACGCPLMCWPATVTHGIGKVLGLVIVSICAESWVPQVHQSGRGNTEDPFSIWGAFGKQILRRRALALPSLLGMVHRHLHPLSW